MAPLKRVLVTFVPARRSGSASQLRLTAEFGHGLRATRKSRAPLNPLTPWANSDAIRAANLTSGLL